MRFKIKNTEIVISFTFFALILLFISVNNFRMYLLTLIFGLIHELVHLIFIYKLSLPPQKITLTLFGADIKRNSNITIKSFYEILINISAPLFNILLGIFIQSFVKNISIFSQRIIEINMILGLFNLLPFYNFDGGNALRNLLLMKLNEALTEKILTITSVCVMVFFSMLTFIAFHKYKSNYSMIIISLYFLLSLVFKK